MFEKLIAALLKIYSRYGRKISRDITEKLIAASWKSYSRHVQKISRAWHGLPKEAQFITETIYLFFSVFSSPQKTGLLKKRKRATFQFERLYKTVELNPVLFEM